MREYEFYCTPYGELLYREGDETKRFTKFRSQMVKEILAIIREFYPQTYMALKELHFANREDIPTAHYQMAAHFIRCNFGEQDTLTIDFDDGILNFEEVRCPLRGATWLCPFEGIICKPKGKANLSAEEKKALRFYAEGYTPDEIATMEGKNVNTIKTFLLHCKRKLGVNRKRELIRKFRTLNL